jgi:hypothetical protein
MLGRRRDVAAAALVLLALWAGLAAFRASAEASRPARDASANAAAVRVASGRTQPARGSAQEAAADDDAATPAPRRTAGRRDTCGGWCADVCGEMDAARWVRGGDVKAATAAYLRRHVVFAVVTGSFEQFFRVDVALCSWLRHAPPANVVVVTDNATKAVATNPALRGRVRWLEGALPAGVRFTRAQLSAKGYTIGWIRAQFRFVQGFEAIAAMAGVQRGGDAAKDGSSSSSSSSSSGSDSSGATAAPREDGAAEEAGEETAGLDARWFVVLDDDTFTNMDALAAMLQRYDAKLGKAGGGGAALKPKAEWTPTYLGENGWGGAGHIMNYAAIRRFIHQGHAPCVQQNLVRKFYASDVALKKCMPGLGIDVVHEKRMSHCQANFLRERLVGGAHVTAHVKRDFVRPRALALWRLRLYYQAAVHRNRTAYALLLRVGACAYGASCKLWKCLEPHDAAALLYFRQVSGNGSFVPTL